MKQLKRLQWFSFYVKGRSLKEQMRENKALGRYINPLGIMSKNALPF